MSIDETLDVNPAMFSYQIGGGITVVCLNSRADRLIVAGRQSKSNDERRKNEIDR